MSLHWGSWRRGGSPGLSLHWDPEEGGGHLFHGGPQVYPCTGGLGGGGPQLCPCNGVLQVGGGPQLCPCSGVLGGGGPQLCPFNGVLGVVVGGGVPRSVCNEWGPGEIPRSVLWGSSGLSLHWGSWGGSGGVLGCVSWWSPGLSLQWDLGGGVPRSVSGRAAHGGGLDPLPYLGGGGLCLMGGCPGAQQHWGSRQAPIGGL